MKKVKWHQILIIFVVGMINSQNVIAESSVDDFYNEFKKGQYQLALEKLESISPLDIKENSIEFKSYLKAICYSRLQEYDKAVRLFEFAIASKNDRSDLFYEYGQALYASNEIKKAQTAFKKSIELNFNVDTSKYYCAHISEMLGNTDEAKEIYSELVKSESTNNKIKQIATYKLSDIAYEKIKSSNKNSDAKKIEIEELVLPLMKNAKAFDEKSNLAIEIEEHYKEIQKEYDLDPNVLLNGKRVSEKKFSASFSQKIKHDNNVSLVNEENNITASVKKSFIYESEAMAKYDYMLLRKMIISPETRLTYIQHSDQKSSDVYQNDAFLINTAIKNKYEHLIFNKPASFKFDIAFNKTYRDFNQVHRREHYADAITFGIGESFSYFKMGDTTIEIKMKDFNATTASLKNKTTTVNLYQTFAFANKHLLIALLEADLTDNYNNKSTNTNAYLLRFDYMIPEIIPSYTLALGLANTVTDTLKQKSSRGMETTINPSIEISKDITEKFKMSLSYDLTKNNSKSSSYHYSKNVFGLELRFQF